MYHILFVGGWVGLNTTLAIVPVVVGRIIAQGIERDIDRAAAIRWRLWAPMLLLWLLFLPNGAYLLTEWRHYLSIVGGHSAFYLVYHDQHYAPGATAKLLGLTAFFGIYSLSGLVATFCAIWPLERLAARYIRTGPMLGVLFALTSLGVYIGLVDRLNSWQLTPSAMTDIFMASVRVATHPELLVVLVMFAAFLRVVYATFAIFIRGWHADHSASGLLLADRL